MVHQTEARERGEQSSQQEVPIEIDLIQTDTEDITYNESKDKEEAEQGKTNGRPIDLREAESIGDSMDVPKREGDIRFSSFNPKGLKSTDIQFQIQMAIEMDIDVQGYSEVNANFLNTKVRQAFRDKVQRVDKEARSQWATSLVTSPSEFKMGGSGLATFSKVAPRIKDSGTDRMGRWCIKYWKEKEERFY